MTLLWLAPNLPSCESCQQWLYDEDWKKVERPRGNPLPRPKGCPTPCWKCPKSLDGKPNPGAELSGKNCKAYQYYRECRADTTGILPRDRLVIRNNSIIQTVEAGLTQRPWNQEKPKK